MDVNSPCLNCGFLKFSDRADDDALPRDLLTTNYPPSDVEAVHIRGVIEDAQTRLSNLNTSIAVLEDLLTKLRGDRKKATEDIHRGRAILSIIRRLPVDILSEIFACTLPDPVAPRRRPTSRCPWLLGRICSHWRTVSLSVSTLWSNIESNSPPQLIIAQIRRSRGSALNVRVISSHAKTLGPLLDCSHRWRSVDILTGVNMLSILDRVHGKIPMLRELKYGDSTGIGCGKAFEIAPQLTNVIVNGRTVIRLPWAQITRLRQRIPPLEGLSQLAAAHNLVELSLNNSVSLGLSLPHARGQPESVLEFPRLRMLYIEDGAFLDFLLLPALEDVYVIKSISSLTSLIDRSLCPIQKLTASADERCTELIPILARTSTLFELRLGLSSNAELEGFISHLTVPPRRPDDDDYLLPCPNLRSISLCNGLDQRQCSLLIQMAQSRLHSAACSNLAVCRVVDLMPGLVTYSTKSLSDLRAIGVDAEWHSEKVARRKLIEWTEEYP